MADQRAATLADEAALAALAAETVSYAASHGIVMRDAGDPDRANGTRFTPAPLALLPAPLPRAAFEGAVALQRDVNALVHAVAADPDLLERLLGDTAAEDDWVRRLLELRAAVRRAGGGRGTVALGLHRTDYMMDSGEGRMLQVEINTIAAAFGALATRVAAMHAHTAAPGAPRPPPNRWADVVPAALARASALAAGEGAVVVMAVQEGERNSSDQRLLEYELRRAHGVRLVRMTLAQLEARSRTDEASGNLVLAPGGERVGVLYLRAGYRPEDMATAAEWAALQRAELSRAAVCPTVSYHLAGTKRVQQALAAKDGLLAGLVGDEAARRLRLAFASMWNAGDGPNDADTRAAIADAAESPAGYVLKPQREGGGNNLWGGKISERLRSAAPGQLSAYILMRRIAAPRQRGALMAPDGKWRVGATLSEYGVYGAYIRDGDEEVLNTDAGYVVRTKFDGVDEGGVATGYSCLDSLVLADDDGGDRARA